LIYDQSKESVLQDILGRYKGKVVVVDVWATWCGPCIEASGKIKSVKEKFSEDDVVFVYLTDEGSDQHRWKELADFIGGEHYYLYRNQYKNINKQFSIETIPSYLIFGKDGQLVEKYLGGYMGNEKLTEWLNAVLAK
jgi:thiol-disulfide isomerase/thioredoxin